MSNLTILRTYALKNPEDLPASVLFSHSAKTMTIFDAYPKSIFHFLVLPRVPSSPTSPKFFEDTESSQKEPGEGEGEEDVPQITTTTITTPSPSVADLSNLRALLNSTDVKKKQAKEVILSLKEDALSVKMEIQQEMEKRFGFQWDVWIGFHGAPSMEHIHLHVLSADLCSDRMKVKKHYNSFRPKLGFFLDVDEVLSWFDAEPSYYQNMAKLPRTQYEVLLKETLVCFHCKDEQKNMPTLKLHLQTEWEELKKSAEASKKRKLKLDKAQSHPPSDLVEKDHASPVHKKLKRDKS